MSFVLRTTNKIDDAADFIVFSILKQLKLGKAVLFFVTGGSSISVGVKVSELLKEYSDQNLFRNLTITLTDERYGPPGHADSNWQQLIEKDFNIPQAKLVPILTGDDFALTIEKFNTTLKREFDINKENKYIIGLFGIGADGHTAGILPDSLAVISEELACGYETKTFSRITITPKVIEKFNEAVVWAQGENKWNVVEDLVLSKNIDIMKQPAQMLKKVPLLTIFSDYKL